MRGEPLLSYPTLFGFLFTLARVSCVFAFLPLAAFRGVEDRAKIVLALGFTVILFPEWSAPRVSRTEIGPAVAGVAGEAALGLAIGMAVAIVLEIFQIAAQIISLQAGFGLASTIDPSSGADSTVLLTVAQITAGLLFFATGADRLLVRALADSMRLCPPGSFRPDSGMADSLTRFAGGVFGTGLRLAAPIITLLLLADVSLAVLGRIQSQIHLVSLTIPVKLGIAMLAIAATLAYQPRFFENAMTSAIRLIEAFLRSGHHG
jgi:flagellar biosynthetic protein FliR